MKVFIFLSIDADFAVADGVGPHVTLVYSDAAGGTVADWVSAVADAVGLAPKTVETTGDVEQFGPEDEPVPAAVLDPAGIEEIRRHLLAGAAERGCSAVQTWPEFRPHITLASEMPVEKVSTPVVAVGLRVVDGDVTHTIQWAIAAEDASVIAEQRWADRPPLDPDAVPIMRQVPDGFVVGRPFRCARVGAIFDRYTGRRRGRALTRDLLADAVRYFAETGDQVPVDREHKEREPNGIAVGMAVVDGGESLAVLPAYNARRPQRCQACQAGHCAVPEHEPLAEYVDRLQGVLWPSPRIQWARGDRQFFCASSGRALGRCRIPNIAVTTEPATSHDQVDEVRLNVRETPMDDILEKYRLAGMPEGVLDALRDKLASLPEGASEADMQQAATSLLSSMIAALSNKADQPGEPPASDEAADQPAEQAHDEAMAEEPAEPAGDEAMADEPAEQAMAEEPEQAHDEAMADEPAEQAMAEEPTEQAHDEAMAEDRRAALRDQVTEIVREVLDARTAEPPTKPAWDPLGGVAEERFNEGIQRGAWGRADREVYLSMRSRIEAGEEGMRDAFDATFGRTRPVVEERLSAPGPRPAPKTANTRTAEAQLRAEGKEHPRGTAGVLDDWQRTNDPRLSLLS